MTITKQKVAVFIGGKSPEHDVSVVTGLQVFQAIDRSRFDPFVVYVDVQGRWLVGQGLEDQNNYLPDENMRKKLAEVTLDVSAHGVGTLLPQKISLFGGVKPIEFDIAMPAFHGLVGEDGNFQGLFEVAGIPYTGARTLMSAVYMDKAATKYVMKTIGVPVLPYVIIDRPDQGYLLSDRQLKDLESTLDFPVIVKPCHLGSSIGVSKVSNIEELNAVLPAVFEYDTSAIVEPFVENLVEYNVAVSRASGELRTSAIERPLATDELLDFKQKYMSGGDNKTGSKNSSQISEGMLSLTRDINPEISDEMADNLKRWARQTHDALGGTGAPRIDFLSNGKTGELWLNEVNLCPGSFGYFLWEAAEDHPVLFSNLLTSLLEEAVRANDKTVLPADPVPAEARLLKRA